MKFIVDARMMQSGGIGTYLQQILPYFDCEILKLNSSIYSLKEQIELPQAIPECDLYWVPHFNVPLLPIKAKRCVVTIHDLYHLDQMSHAKKLYAKMLLKRAVSLADQIITISEFSKGRLLHYFPAVEKKVHMIHLGSDHLLKEKEIPNLPKSFLLFVGNLKPHKNLKVVFDALLTLKDKHLVIAGQMGGFHHGMNLNEVKTKYRALEGRLHFLGKVSDDELTWLYTHAEALVFPSLYEGWGLPTVEAMQLGLPVIASTAASIPEACREAAAYFDPNNPKMLIEAIHNLPSKKNSLVLAGKKRVQELTWKKTIEAHGEVFATRPYTSSKRMMSSSST